VTKPTDPVALADESLQRHQTKLYNWQKEMIYPMFEALHKKGVVFVGQGPTGMGKTLVIGAVTKALVSEGKRVCIAVPTYAHLKDVMQRHLDWLDIEYAVIRGLSALGPGEGCPLKGGELPSPIFCSDLKGALTGPDSERCKEIMCTVRKERLAAEKSSVVLAVCQKILSRPNILADFDVAIFDESHNIEPMLRRSRIPRVNQEDLRSIIDFLPNEKENLSSIIGSLDRVRDRIDVPIAFVERRIIEPLRTSLDEAEKMIHALEEDRKHIPTNVINAFYMLQSASRAMDRPGSYRFINHDGSILAIPNEVNFFADRVKDRSNAVSIALVSATIENPKFHAVDSGFSYHSLAAPIQVEPSALIERFRNRPIYGMMDGPVLRKDPKSPESYSIAREEANKLIAQLVPSFEQPVLVLCRSKDDARSIQRSLKLIQSLQKRLYIFDEESEEVDNDLIQRTLNDQIDSGKNVILTSASSRLWEGINIKRLRLLIVDALPYPSPLPYESRETAGWSSWRTSRTFRFMIRRMQQGIGRLMRTELDPWGLALVIDGRFYAQWPTIRSALPRYMTDKGIVHFVPKDKLSQEVNEKRQRLETLETAKAS
jgi:Rad3-related DNA helicase